MESFTNVEAISTYLKRTPIPDYLFKLVTEYLLVQWYTDREQRYIFQIYDDEYKILKYNYQKNRIFDFDIKQIGYPIRDKITFIKELIPAHPHSLLMINGVTITYYEVDMFKINQKYITDLRKSLLHERVINFQYKISKILKRHINRINKYKNTPRKILNKLLLQMNQNSIFYYYNIDGRC